MQTWTHRAGNSLVLLRPHHCLACQELIPGCEPALQVGEQHCEQRVAQQREGCGLHTRVCAHRSASGSGPCAGYHAPHGNARCLELAVPGSAAAQGQDALPVVNVGLHAGLHQEEPVEQGVWGGAVPPVLVLHGFQLLFGRVGMLSFGQRWGKGHLLTVCQPPFVTGVPKAVLLRSPDSKRLY